MPIWINDGGTPRNLNSLYVNDNGTVRDLQKVWVNDNGTVRLVFSKGVISPANTTFYEFVLALESALGTNVLSAGPLSSTTRAEGVSGIWEIILAPGYSFGGTNTVVGSYNNDYTTRYLFNVDIDGNSTAYASSSYEQFKGGNFTVNYADPDAFSIIYDAPTGLAGFPHRATWGNAAGGAVQSNTFLWTIPVSYSSLTVAGIGGGGGGGTGGGFGISNSATGGGGGGGGAYNTGVPTTGTTFSIRLGLGGTSYPVDWVDRGPTGQAGGNTAVNTGATTLFLLNGGGGGVGGLNTFDEDTVNVGGAGGTGQVNASTGAAGGKGSTGSTSTDFGFNGGNNSALGTTGGIDTGQRTQFGSGGGGGGGAGWDNGGNAAGPQSFAGTRGAGGGGGNGEGNGGRGGDGYVQFTWDPLLNVNRTGFGVYTLLEAETRNIPVSLGPSGANRYTAIALTGKQSGTFSATLGGIPMTVHAMTQWTDRAFSVILFCNSSSLGSTETLSITCTGGSVGRNGVAVFRLDDIATVGAEYSIKDPNTTIPSSIADPMTETFTVSDNTFVLAVSASDEYLWSYITGLTNQYGSSIESQAAHAGSWEFFETGQSVTVTNPVNQSGSGGTGTGGERTLSIVTFT